MLGGPVIGNLPRGLPQPRRAPETYSNIILQILQIVKILLMYFPAHLLSSLANRENRENPAHSSSCNFFS